MPDERSFLDQIRLSHGLSRWQATAHGLGVTVTLAAFVLMGEAVATAGPQTPWAFFLAALLVIVNGLGYAELALSVHRPGGTYTLVHEGEGGDALEFLTGWALTLSGLGLSALLAQGAARYLALLLGDLLGNPVPTGLWAMGLIALSTLLSSLGRRRRRRMTSPSRKRPWPPRANRSPKLKRATR